jgi:hypothetical protein
LRRLLVAAQQIQQHGGLGEESSIWSTRTSSDT